MSFAKNGDMSSAQMAVLSMLLKTNFLGDIMMNLTLNIMQKPMREQIQDWQNQDVKEMNIQKFNKLNDFKNWVQRMKNNVLFFSKDYDFKSISYKSMQDLLNGKIKKWKDLEYAYYEVTIFYKCITDQDIFIIDSFFINVNK